MKLLLLPYESLLNRVRNVEQLLNEVVRIIFVLEKSRVNDRSEAFSVRNIGIALYFKFIDIFLCILERILIRYLKITRWLHAHDMHSVQFPLVLGLSD